MAGKVSIRIDADGNTHLEVNGCEGNVCENITDALMRGLGVVEERQLKVEYYQDRPDYVENMDGGGTPED